MSFPTKHIQDACKMRKTTIAELERNSGIGNGVIKGWEKAKGTPQLHQLVAIAECLDMPFDFVAFGKEKTAPNNEDGLSDAEKDFIRLFRMLPVASQDAVIQHIRGLVLLQTVRDTPATTL